MPLNLRIMYNRAYYLLKFIKVYMIVRVVLLVSYFVEAGFIVHTELGCKMPNIEYQLIKLQHNNNNSLINIHSHHLLSHPVRC